MGNWITKMNIYISELRAMDWIYTASLSFLSIDRKTSAGALRENSDGVITVLELSNTMITNYVLQVFFLFFLFVFIFTLCFTWFLIVIIY